MSCIEEPILFALSDISTIAMLASCAAASVSRLTLESRLAAKLVVDSMESLAESPAVL